MDLDAALLFAGCLAAILALVSGALAAWTPSAAGPRLAGAAGAAALVLLGAGWLAHATRGHGADSLEPMGPVEMLRHHPAFPVLAACACVGIGLGAWSARRARARRRA